MLDFGCKWWEETCQYKTNKNQIINSQFNFEQLGLGLGYISFAGDIEGIVLKGMVHNP